MLLKVETLEEIGRFSRLKHKAPMFEALTLIFARNGYGKSTLCSVLRSVAEQDPLIINARRRLGATSESRVHLQWKLHGLVKFTTGQWSACPEHIHVFDQEYIRRNLHVAESVTRENRRSLLPVVLGEGGVELIANTAKLDVEQRELAISQNTAERAITAAHPIVKDVATFVLTDIPTDIDGQIEASVKKLELARHALAVKERGDPKSVSVPSVVDVESLLRRGLDTINDRAEAAINEHIATHNMHPNGSRWLSYGVHHMHGSACPFCTQETSGIAIVGMFRGFFSSEYSSLCSEIDVVLTKLVSDLGEGEGGIHDAAHRNKDDFEFWNRVCDFGDIPVISDVELDNVVRSYKQLIVALEKKKLSPLTLVSVEDRDFISASIEAFSSYQKSLKLCVLKIAAARAEAQPYNVPILEEILHKREALKARLSPPLKENINAWLFARMRRKEIEEEKRAAQERLKKYLRDVIAPRQKAINDLLEVFGANFQIVDTKASFVGREANTEFSIAIGPHTVKAGERLTDKPSFTTVLSAGDKSTLALAFFITQMRSYANLKSSTIVFDDPFSSQDMDRQWETTSQLRALAKDVDQVIVMSHDPRFLALIEKNYRAPCLSLQLMCDSNGLGSLSSWSSFEELKDVYVRQAERIREYASNGMLLKSITEESLSKDLRPFLENFLRARFPGRFAPLKMLHDMADEIENAGSDDPAHKDIPVFRAINEYGRDNMHGGAENPNPAGLRAQCRRIIRVIGTY